MSTLKVDTLDTSNGTGNINVSRPLSGSGASLTNLPAANLTGTLPALSGASLTNLPAANLTGTVATARLGSGTASSSTFLRGDQTYATAGGGKVLQLVGTTTSSWGSTTISSTNNTWTDTVVFITFTPLSSTSKFLVSCGVMVQQDDTSGDAGYSIRIKKVQGGTSSHPSGLSCSQGGSEHGFYYQSPYVSSAQFTTIVNYVTFQGRDDTSSLTSSSVTYTLQVAQYNYNSLQVGSVYAGRPQMSVLEVEV